MNQREDQPGTPLGTSDPMHAVVGSAPAIVELREQLQRLSSFDSVRSPHVPTVLLCGETGTGKGLIARTLHDCGPRAAGPFIDVNCAAIPETMLEAELFGFEEGAFTDAKRAKPGLFEAAAEGSLFLDEIDSCSLTLQSKLLKVIEDKSCRRLGSLTSQSIDTKLIAASQRNLADLVSFGHFRADLYHRLAVVVLQLPTLAERIEDIPLLARHYLDRYADAHGLAPKALTADGELWLIEYGWPGNVRELSHLMERVTLLVTNHEVDSETFEKLRVPVTTRAPAVPFVPSAALPTAAASAPAVGGSPSDEASEIRDALRRAGGNVAAAARILGVGRNALRYRMRRHGIEKPTAQELAAATAGTTTIAEAPTSRIAPPKAPPPQQPKAPLDPEPPSEPTAALPQWEERTTTVLSMEIVTPNEADGVIRSDPWTIARRWQDRIIADRIRGFGGTILQSDPSRITAVFGVPKALEQSPQRAIRCGMTILRQLAEETERGRAVPQIRLAIHLGPLQFDANAADLAASVLATGDTLVLPQRLLAFTADREILVSASVARRIEKDFEIVDRPVRFAGSGENTEAYTVVGATKPKNALARSPELRFVGRQHEIDLIHDSFGRSRTGNGQLVFLVGDAGIGKSRLIQEFRQSLKNEDCAWVEGRCAAYGTSTAFLPIVNALRSYLEIEDRDDEAAAEAKIAERVDALGDDLQWTKPFLRQILSMKSDERATELDPGRRRSEIFRALQSIAIRESERRPLIICIEDLHWIDEASEEFLVFLAETLPASRALLLCSYRPGYQHPFGDRSYHQRLSLTALSIKDTASIAESALGVHELPAEVKELIAEKAEGNPFYIEEIAASLIEDGSIAKHNGKVQLMRRREEIDVPDTIQDVLIARIDRLADEPRLAIQIAAVIGREFALRLLERISETGDTVRGQINELRALELIYEKGMHPELAYMFKHALTHDVAYNSVHHRRRTDLHRIIGLAIEELYTDRLAEHYETLAHHFSEGHDWQRALHYHTMAAEKAAESHANRSVTEHCQRGLAIAAQLGEAIADPAICNLEERSGLALFYLSEFRESGRAYERAAARASDAHVRAILLASSGLSFFWAHDYEDTSRVLSSAKQLADASNDKAALSVVGYLASTYEGIINADFETYERHCNQALLLQQESGSELAEGIGCFARSELYEWTGRYQQAVEVADRGIAIGKKLKLSHIIIWPMWFGAKAQCCLGNYGEALSRLHEASDLCARIGDRAWRSRMLNTLGWCYAEIGAHETAAGYNTQAAALAHDIGDLEIIANSEINIALNHLAAGHLDEAEELIAPMRAHLEGPPDDPWMFWRFALHVLNADARIAIARRDLDQALQLTERQVSSAATHRAPKIEARAAALCGQILLDMDRRPEALEALSTAAQVAEQIQYRRGFCETLKLASEAHRRDGNAQSADEAIARARQLAAASADSLSDEQLRRRLLAEIG